MHSFTNNITFEHVYLHLVLSSYLDNKDLKNLNKCHPLFRHLCKILTKICLDYVYDLFDYDLNYSSQESILQKRQLQYLFLALIHCLHILNMIRVLKGNQTAAYRDSKVILEKYKPVLLPKLWNRFREVLYNMNPTKFHGHTTTADREECRKYSNYSSVDKNILQVKKTMNKEECNKYVVVLPSWIEYFIPHLHLSP